MNDYTIMRPELDHSSDYYLELSIPDLMDLLSTKTNELLAAIHEKDPSRYRIYFLKKEVEQIQQAIILNKEKGRY